MSEKSPKISFRGNVTKCERYFFYCRRTYVVWQSYEKMGAETVEKVCLKKLNAKQRHVRCSKCSPFAGTQALRAKLHYTDTGYEHVLQHHTNGHH